MTRDCRRRLLAAGAAGTAAVIDEDAGYDDEGEPANERRLQPQTRTSNTYKKPLLVHCQVTIIFVVSVCLFVCLFVCLCRVFLNRL